MIRQGVVAAALMMFIVNCEGHEDDARLPKAVRVAEVEAATAREATVYSAVIAPNAQVDLAFRIPGYVVYLQQARGGDGRIRPLEAAAAVTRGMTLARIRPADYQAAVDKARGARDEANAGIGAAEAQLAEAWAALTQAELDFERMSKLWQQESITKPAYDASKARADMARAKVDSAKAGVAAASRRASAATGQLHEAEIAFQDTALRSPLAGTLLERRVEVGSFVTPGVPAFVVADLSTVKARFNVPDRALPTFRNGQSLPLTIDAFAGQRFEGHVVSVAAAADPRARSFEIVVSIPNPDLKLRSGVIASIEVPESADRRYLQIPIDALVHDAIQDRYVAYTIEEKDGHTVARAIPIRPGPLEGNQVTILEGLTQGQSIVVSGANLLRPGDFVRVVH